MPLAVALFSGSLDSTLAVRIVQEQGWQVHALFVDTPLGGCRRAPDDAARRLGIPLSHHEVDDDYLEVLCRPRFGYGRGVNPCIDCRAYMAAHARRLMEEKGAELVISGEVVGQRPMSQKRRDLETIEYHAGLERRLLRPLSAQLLAPTWAEQAGTLDREAFFAFSGQSRKPLLALARRLGLTPDASPSGGCPLAEPSFAPRVFDLRDHSPDARLWHWRLLRWGRHFRLDGATQAIVGRNAEENAALRQAAEVAPPGVCQVLSPLGFSGPDALLVGPATPEAIGCVGQLLARYSRLGEGPFRISVGLPPNPYELTLLADPRAAIPPAL